MTYLESLQQVEEPLLQVIFEGVHQQVSVGDIGMGQHRLVGKVSLISAFIILEDIETHLNLLPSFPPPVVHQSASALMTATL